MLATDIRAAKTPYTGATNRNGLGFAFDWRMQERIDKLEELSINCGYGIIEKGKDLHDTPRFGS